MKISIETCISVIIITVMALFCTCSVVTAGNIRSAQNFHSSVIAELEASNLSETVVTECIADAKNNGFVKKEGENEVSGLEIVDVAGGIKEVSLTYDYTIPFLNLFLQHEIVGYAR